MEKKTETRLKKYYLGTLLDAIRRDDHMVVKLLMERHKIDPNDSEDADYQSPLHFAVAYDSRQSIPILLDHGANPFQRDSDGESPLDSAIQKGDLIMSGLLKINMGEEN